MAGKGVPTPEEKDDDVVSRSRRLYTPSYYVLKTLSLTLPSSWSLTDMERREAVRES